MFDKTPEIISELLKSWDGKMLLVSVGLLLITFLVAGVQILGLVRYKRARFWTIPRCLAIGIFFSTAWYLFSYYYFLRDTGPLQSVLHAIWHTLQMFVLDGDAGNLAEVFKDTCENPLHGSDIVQNEYIFFASVIRILAPLTTFAFLLTFVKNIYAHILYFFRKFWTDTHVFSELNEKSLALAENLKNHPFSEGSSYKERWRKAQDYLKLTRKKIEDEKDWRKAEKEKRQIKRQKAREELLKINKLPEDKRKKIIEDKKKKKAEQRHKRLSLFVRGIVNPFVRLLFTLFRWLCHPLARTDTIPKSWTWATDYMYETKKRLIEWKQSKKTIERIEKSIHRRKFFRLWWRCNLNFFVWVFYSFLNWLCCPTIVFTDVTDKREEENMEWVDTAKEIGAILFRKDLEAISHRRIVKKKKQCIYLISEDEPEKIRHTINIIDRWKNFANVNLYVFSDKAESKAMLDSHTEKEREEMRMSVIRVNDARALIYHNLDVGQEDDKFPVRGQDGEYIKSSTTGMRLFENAIKIAENKRRISAVIVGLGRYGMEMFKALLWFCQFPGYEIKITALDEAEDIKSKVQAMCPEIILDVPYTIPGDMRYEVHVESVRVGTKEFFNQLEGVQDVTYVFVGLGQDDLNLSTATMIENHMIALGRMPDIDTIVYNSDLAEQMREKWAEEKDHSDKCRIRIIGDLKSFYSPGTVILSKLDEEGFAVHMRWCGGNEEGMTKRQRRHYREKMRQQFHLQDYGYFSSLSSALHRRLRKKIACCLDNPKVYAYFCELFPAFYQSNAESPLERERREGFEYIFKQIANDAGSKQNEEELYIKQLSKCMREFGRCLYIKLGHIHYQKLSDKKKKKLFEELERKFILEPGKRNYNYIKDFVYNYERFVSEYTPEVPDHGENSYNENLKEDLKLVFDQIVKTSILEADLLGPNSQELSRSIQLSYEYSCLTPDEQEIVKEYVKVRFPNAVPLLSFDQFLQIAECASLLEHIRWNAYMRTEGVCLSVKKAPEHKLHPLLIPVKRLTLEEKIKDI